MVVISDILRFFDEEVKGFTFSGVGFFGYQYTIIVKDCTIKEGVVYVIIDSETQPPLIFIDKVARILYYISLEDFYITSPLSTWYVHYSTQAGIIYFDNYRVTYTHEDEYIPFSGYTYCAGADVPDNDEQPIITSTCVVKINNRKPYIYHYARDE